MMRISGRKDDPGYHKRVWSYQAFIDNVKVAHCFTADEDRGYVLRYKTDGRGHLIVDRSKDEIAIEQLFGRVQVRRAKC